MIRYLIYALLAFIVWKLVRLALSVRQAGGAPRPKEPPVDFPPDHSYKNIEDADFEDVTRDPDKPS